jgi:hypothetical protein
MRLVVRSLILDADFGRGEISVLLGGTTHILVFYLEVFEQYPHLFQMWINATSFMHLLGLTRTRLEQSAARVIKENAFTSLGTAHAAWLRKLNTKTKSATGSEWGLASTKVFSLFDFENLIMDCTENHHQELCQYIFTQIQVLVNNRIVIYGFKPLYTKYVGLQPKTTEEVIEATCARYQSEAVKADLQKKLIPIVRKEVKQEIREELRAKYSKREAKSWAKHEADVAKRQAESERRISEKEKEAAERMQKAQEYFNTGLKRKREEMENAIEQERARRVAEYMNDPSICEDAVYLKALNMAYENNQDVEEISDDASDWNIGLDSARQQYPQQSLPKKKRNTVKLSTKKK